MGAVILIPGPSMAKLLLLIPEKVPRALRDYFDMVPRNCLSTRPSVTGMTAGGTLGFGESPTGRAGRPDWLRRAMSSTQLLVCGVAM